MILDYIPETQKYVLKVPRHEGELVQSLMRDHGLNFSEPASTPHTAVLYTDTEYCAAHFWEYATERAQKALSVIHTEIEKSWASDIQCNVRCPAEKELWPFQRASLAYALSRPHTLVGDQPGLGKTPIAICFANEIRAKKVLVLCPGGIRLQWISRIQEWSTMRRPIVAHAILKGKNGVHPKADWVVCSYDLARTPAIHKQLADEKWDLLILDEAHYLKTTEAGRTRAVFGFAHGKLPDGLEPIAARAERILALTGTPLPNRPREAYVMARNLCLGASTRVITNRGTVPILKVTKDDLLWNGKEWVQHAGVAFKGLKRTATAMGLEATGDHKILAGGIWTTWSNVLEGESTRSHALGTGLESLRSLATAKGKVAYALRWPATVGERRIRSQLATSAMGNRYAASIVEMLLSRPRIADGLTWLRTFCLGRDRSFYPVFPALLAGVSAHTMRNMIGMGREAFGCTPFGSTIMDRFSLTSPRCQTASSADTNWTEPTIAEGTSQGTYVGYHGQTICEIEEQRRGWKPEYRSLRPVYDVVNAGVDQRFTIITDAGPLVVHNCWDSIDWMSEDKFKERFNPSVQIERVDRDTGRTKFIVDERAGRHSELQSRLRANFMVRHLKKDVLTQLPEVMLDIIQMEETGPVKQALKAEQLLDIDPETLTGIDMSFGQIPVVRHMMGVALAPQAADYALELLEGGEEKLLIFGYHHAVLDILQSELQSYGIVRVDGRCSTVAKQQAVDDFMAKPEIRVFIGNYLSCGVGVDGLQTVCSRAVFAESSWTPGDNQQAIDRLHRIGQNTGVLIDFIVAPGSISEKVLGKSIRKSKVIHSALDKKMKQISLTS